MNDNILITTGTVAAKKRAALLGLGNANTYLLVISCYIMRGKFVTAIWTIGL
jgi:hypothetical protein